MKFIKINPDVAVNAEKITALKVTGREDNCHVTAHLDDSTVYHLSHYKNFRDAEISLMDMIERLESE